MNMHDMCYSGDDGDDDEWYRGWFVNPAAVTHWWLVVVAIVPALLATILVFLDQQITAVIVNRSEHKLKVQRAALFATSFEIINYHSKQEQNGRDMERKQQQNRFDRILVDLSQELILNVGRSFRIPE